MSIEASREVAFLGLGNMGGPMAANLVAAGCHVRGYDPDPAALARAEAAGIDPVATPAQAVAGADVVVTMLPSGRHLLDLYRGTNDNPGLFTIAEPGTLFVDCSTVDVTAAQTAQQEAARAGHRAIDAPVSGGVGGATAGTLTFMAGAAHPEDLDAARDLLDIMGARIVACGGPGSGQAAKVCNNLILGISMIAVSEAFALGRSLGLTDQALFDVASTSSGQCWSLTTYCPVPGPVPTSPANDDYRPGFSVALMAKDLGLAREAIHAHDVPATLGLAAAQEYDELLARGLGQRDFSVIARELAERTGLA